jgi:hypothetical protein
MSDKREKAKESAAKVRDEAKMAAYNEVRQDLSTSKTSRVLFPIHLYSNEGDYTLMSEDSDILKYFKENTIEDYYTGDELKIEIFGEAVTTIREYAETHNKIPTAMLIAYEAMK